MRNKKPFCSVNKRLILHRLICRRVNATLCYLFSINRSTHELNLTICKLMYDYYLDCYWDCRPPGFDPLLALSKCLKCFESLDIFLNDRLPNVQHNSFFKKWANPGLFLFIFVLFSLQFQYKLKKA